MDISSMLEVQVNEYKEDESKENLTPIRRTMPAIPTYEDISKDEEQFYQLMFNGDIASIRFRKLHCTSCDVHIGSAPSSAKNMREHPILRTLLCGRCYDFYGDGTFEQGDDETDMFCRWCANGGNLYCCATCSNTFCYKCIKRNFDPSIRKKIEADEKWRCFVCDPTDLYPLRSTCRAIIQHVQIVTRLLEMDKTMSAKEIEEKMNLDESPCCPRKRKRRRKRTGSNSEEEDESYTPTEVDTSNLPTKRRRSRRSQNSPFANGDADDEEEDSNSAKIEIDENSSPALHCEQSMIESENEIVAPDGKIIRNPQLLAVQSRPLPQAPFKKVVSINPIPTAHLMKISPMFQSGHLKNSMDVRLPQIMPRGPRVRHPTPPMVSIPTQPSILRKKPRPRLILPKTRMILNAPKQTITPSVINLDSDEEVLEVVDSNKKSKNLNESTQEQISTAVSTDVTLPTPVENELPTSSNQIKLRAKPSSDQQLPPSVHKSPNTVGSSFKSMLMVKNREIDTILNPLKHNLKKTINDPGGDYENIEQVEKRVKGVYKVIHKAITKFAEHSDLIAHAFDRWKERNLCEETSQVNEELEMASADDLSLEMLCSNESDDENEDKESEENELPVRNTLKGSMFDDFVFIRKRQTRDIGIGDWDLSVRDAQVQVVDVEMLDLEEHIGYSMVTKVEIDDSSSDTVKNPDHNFGKYFEQYLHHLKLSKNPDVITEEDTHSNSSTRSKSIELMEVDSIETTEPSVVNSDKLENQSADSENPADNTKVNTENPSNNTEVDTENPADNTKVNTENPVDNTEVNTENVLETNEESSHSNDAPNKDYAVDGKKFKSLPDPNETPLKDLIEANSPFISEMLRSIGTPVLTNGSCSTEQTKQFSYSTADSHVVENLADDKLGAKKQPCVDSNDETRKLVD